MTTGANMSPILYDDFGTVTKYAWPGGYRVWYVADDGESLCAECVQENLSTILGSIIDDVADGWRVEGYYTEADADDCGPCAHCGRVADIDNVIDIDDMATWN